MSSSSGYIPDYQWTLGITDRSPRTWRNTEPLWQDEKITATNSHSFLDLMVKLCETAMKDRREHNDYGVNAHLWDLRITSYQAAISPGSGQITGFKRALGKLSGLDNSDDDHDDDDDEEPNNTTVLIKCPSEYEHANEDYDDDDISIVKRVRADVKLSSELLPEASVVQVTYDYGTTTTLFLKVLSIKPVAVESLIQYFSDESDTDQLLKEMQAVPAYQLQKNQQIDHYFPNFSRAFLGLYVPLYKNNDSSTFDDEEEKAIACVSLGLSAKIRYEYDTLFCTMENRTSDVDLLLCPSVLDPNEFLEVAEKAWVPRDDPAKDPDELHGYRYDMICRYLVGSEDDETYERLMSIINADEGFGSYKLIFRASKDSKPSGFHFDKIFPKTFAMLKSGKFRWFQYKNETLRIIAGRGTGEFCRDFDSSQILKTWKHKFQSFHDLLCAVEASWFWQGKELTPEMVLPQFDTFMGPSKPGPKEPPVLGLEKDSIMISSCSELKKLVTALAIAEESGKSILYSGHDDGTLTKWSLDENKQLWTRCIYTDGTKDYSGDRYEMHVRDIPGVAGLVVRPNPKEKDQSLLYTWTHAYNGYPHRKFEQRDSSALAVLSGKDGKCVRRYLCDIGEDDEGRRADPTISTVVFCKLYIREENSYVDSILVGLYCTARILEYDDSFSDYNIKEAQDFSEGNIVPLREEPNGTSMETWRGHEGPIRATAVIGQTYLLSYSIRPGHGLPDALIVWSLAMPGVPLCRRTFWDPSRSLLNQNLTRLRGVDGISVDRNEVLMFDNEYDRVAVLNIEMDQVGNPSINFRGFGKLGLKIYDSTGFHGRMAMSRNHAVLANEQQNTVYIYKIKGNKNYNKLERDGKPKRGHEEYDDFDSEMRGGIEMAVGKICFPLWGGNGPTREKKKSSHCFFETVDKSDGLGEGGPMMLAIKGKWVVAGFSNGTLSKMMLPDLFEDTKGSATSSNHLASCSSLPSDTWHIPHLDDDGDDDDDDDDDDGNYPARPEECVLM